MLLVKLLREGAIAPSVAHPGEDIAYDIFSAEEARIFSGQMEKIHTGVALHALTSQRDGIRTAGLLIRDRSSMAAKRLVVTGGVIDAGYRGEIVVLLTNFGEIPYDVHCGDKIAQLIPIPVLTGKVTVIQEFDGSTSRGSAGFGSTGI